MRRRDLLAFLGGETIAWPLAARAQQTNQIRRIGTLFGGNAGAPEKVRLAAFLQALKELGWTEGHNLRVESRWSAANADNIRKDAAELAALAPDVILASGDQTTAQLLRVTQTVPIIFVIVPDPAGRASSTVCRGQTATLPASCSLNTV